MSSLVAMFKVVDFGIVTVEQAFTAFKNCGASSPPLVVKIQGSFGKNFADA